MATQHWPRMTTVQLMKVVVGFALVFGFFSFIANSRRIIETLDSPVAVRGWTQAGLQLADGRTVQLPGIKSLPAHSWALANAVWRGVEVGHDRRVYGLVPVHHWCGNDSVREHIARVDLALYLEYLGEGQATDPPLPHVVVEPPAKVKFSKFGMEVGDYGLFRLWCREVSDEWRTAKVLRLPPPAAPATASPPGPSRVAFWGPAF